MVMIKIVVMNPFYLLSQNDTTLFFLFFFFFFFNSSSVLECRIQFVRVMGPFKAENVNLLRYIANIHMATNS